MPLLKITEAARRLGVSTRTIRFYEEKRLLTPGKTPHNGYRLYSEQDLLRLQTIISLREAGLSLTSLHTVMETYGMEEQDELLYLLELQRALLYARRLDLEGQIRMNERLIHNILTEAPPLQENMFRQAELSRRQRELRDSWTDHYRFDQHAESFDAMVEQGHASYPGYKESLRALATAISPRPGEMGLDLGTGTGNLAGTILPSGADMKALDQSRRMLQLCRRKYPLMETKLGNLLAVPFYEHTFDFAVSSYVFHLLSEAERLSALLEILRVLKPGGRLGIACPLPEAGWVPLRSELELRGFSARLSALPESPEAFVLVASPAAD
ncbi:MAG: transcriptional regulator [Paenibacillaceae bacterium]|nr:transcriptional regulator [Paenibacillaceae bacterium]